MNTGFLRGNFIKAANAFAIKCPVDDNSLMHDTLSDADRCIGESRGIRLVNFNLVMNHPQTLFW